jgi:hypothetical protein
MHRLGIGLLFGAVGLFMQSITEWTYRQTSIMFTFHIMMGALAALYYARGHAAVSVEEEDEDFSVPDVEASPVAMPVARAQR